MQSIKQLASSLAVLALFAAPLTHAAEMEESTTPAPAATDTQGAPASSAYSTADSNGDGTVSMDEFSALGGTEDGFKGADANADGKIDAEEFGKATTAQ